MDWESAAPAEEPADPGGPEAREPSPGLPPLLERILSDCGYLEGLHLKAQGCLSPDLQEFMRGIGYAFEIEVSPQGAFRLPFVDNELAIQRKTLNGFMEQAWLAYHAALLSAYAMRPLRFEKPPGSRAHDMELAVRILPAAPDRRRNGSEGMAAFHQLNNALSGITSYVSLILEERKQDADLQEKLALVLESAKRAGEGLAKPTT